MNIMLSYTRQLVTKKRLKSFFFVNKSFDTIYEADISVRVSK